VLLPLSALLYGSGIIQDEVEGQTLTYLLVRPLPRSAIYLTKLLATLGVTVALTALFVPLTFLAIYLGQAGGAPVASRALQTMVLFALAMIAYCSVFGCISLFAQRSIVVGIAYIILFEGVLANLEFVVRQLTIVYYLRVLAIRWVDVNVPGWRLSLSGTPSAPACVLTLVGVSLAATYVAARRIATREFRMKTPEGN
jgi:ABC-2 type transport system permease protein